MRAVMLFAKAPRAGSVKTRLASSIGAARAVEIYREMGLRVRVWIGGAHPVTVWYDPPDALPEMRAWLGEGEYVPQPEGDLGHRLERAFATHFGRGDQPVIAVGMDAPDVSGDTVREAVRMLETSDVVLGPAVDGGYYLIGLKRRVSGVFERIPWSTEHVLQATLERCERLGLATALLAPLRDIDTIDDLRARGPAGP
jgi:rSAM/selenodomain-associated transferase 1